MKKLLVLLIITLVSINAQAATLYEVYTEALLNDPTYQQAIAQQHADSEGVPLAWSALLPQLSFDTILDTNRVNNKGETTTTPSGLSSNRGYDAKLELNQILFNSAAFNALSAARLEVRAAAATNSAALQNLMLRVATAYFAVLQAEEDVRYATSREAFLARNLDQAQQKHKVGLNTITDVNLAQASYSAAVAALAAANNEYSNQNENLAAITGHTYSFLAPLKNDFPLVSPDPADIQQWVAVALKRNWSLQAAELTSQAAQQGIDIQRAGHYPTLSAQLAYEQTYNKNSILGNRQSFSPGAALNLSIPIFSGGAVLSNTRQAIATYEVVDQQKEFILRNTINLTRTNYLGVLSGIAQIQADQTAIIASTSALDGMETGYRLGTQTMVDVLSAQDKLFDNQTTYATDRYNYLLTSLALKQAAGTLNANDLKNINAWLDLTLPTTNMQSTA